MGDTLAAEAPNLAHLGLTENRVSIGATSVHGSTGDAPTFDLHVGHVVLMRPGEQVIRPHASTVVAAMKNKGAIRISVGCREYGSMSRDALSKEWNPAIAGLLVRFVDALQAVAGRP